ncbi:MAG: cupin domain-containing protein [Gammaproteobacteria bacterium]|nr:cupin domain-containing protein [Gammaproteobacteria bacterium]
MTAKVIRLGRDDGGGQQMSPWAPMPLVGEFLDGTPQERFYRVFDCKINTASQVRAGIWEATRYAEKLIDYPYHEIVFVIEGSISILDELGHEERFYPGECFFLEKGFNGTWKQHETIRILHMTVDPE